MAGENVVSIVVRAADDTAAGFDASKAASESAAEGMKTYTDAVDEAAAAQEKFAAAQEEQRAAAEQVAVLQKDNAASADELTAAQERLTGASVAAADARKKLAAAEKDVATQSKIASDEQVASGLKSDEAATGSGGLMASMGSKAKMALLGVAVGAGIAVKAAMDYQEQSTQLVTGAGELEKNLKMVEQGMLALSVSTDTSTSQLQAGMYMVESAGYHGAAGLKVLQAAAQGAKVGNADLGDVANTLTSILNAYHMKASDATAVTNQMIATVASGKMHMQDLASSISAVLPVANSAHVSFAQVGGALATMTMQGVSAHRAAQNLATTIRSLLSQSNVASNEMRDLGLNANDVSTHLGQRGLTGTISLLTEAILRNSKGGSVLASTYSSMSPAAQGIAREIAAGTITTNGLTTAMKALNPEQAALVTQFKTSATSATGLKQTFDAAMKNMVGGAQGLNTVLELGGRNASVFAGNVKTVGDAAKAGGGQVTGFAETQKDLSFQMGKAEKAVEAAGISLGMALLPAVTAVVRPLASMLQMIAGNKAAAIAFAAVIGGVLAGAIGTKAVGALKDMKSAMEDVVGGIGKLIGKLNGSAAAAKAQAAAAKESAAAQEKASSEAAAAQEKASAESAAASEESAATQEAASSAAATAAETAAAETAAANEEAAAESSGSWLAGLGAQLAAGAAWVAESAAKVAVVVASNLAGAASTAAAWIVANGVMLLGIGAVVAIVAIAVFEIVKHWHAIADAAKDVFRAVKDAVMDAVGFIRSHWQLLLAILTGPIGLAVLWIKDNWKHVTDAFSDVIDWVKSHWQLILAIITGPIGLAALFVKDHLTQITGFFKQAFDRVTGDVHNWETDTGHEFEHLFDLLGQYTRAGLGDVVHWFEGLPALILRALSNLGSMMFSAGRHVISSLLDGVKSMIGEVGSVVGGVAHKIAGFFGLSPAREGELSGSGAPEIRGAHFAAALASGMLSGNSAVRSAAARLASSAGAGTAAGSGLAGSGGTGAPMVLQIKLGSGGSGLEQQFMTWLKNAVRAGGGDPRVFNKKVQFV